MTRIAAWNWRRDLGSLALLALAVFLFFWPITLAGHWMPIGGGDLVSFLWPNTRFAVRGLREGVLPLWNPHFYSGAPFLADNQTGLFYPGNLLLALFTADPSYELIEGMSLLHVWLAGVSAYVCLRYLRPERPLRRSAALVGALAFMLSDTFVTHFGHLNLIAVAAWLPLVFLLAHRALTVSSTERAVSWALGSGVVLGLASLAGFAQMTLYIALTVSLYGLWHILTDWRSALRVLARGGLIGLVSLGVSALALVPAYEMANHTSRAALPYDAAASYALPPAGLTGLVAPGLFGRGPVTAWGPWDRVEMGYAGLLTLVLALVALIPWRRPINWRRVEHFFGLLALFGLLTALGPHTPFHRWLYDLVPSFNQLRSTVRAILLTNFSLALLAAIGMDRLLQPLTAQLCRRWRWLAAGVLIAGLLLALFVLPWVYRGVLQAAPGSETPERRALAQGAIVVLLILVGASAALLFARSGGWLNPALTGGLAFVLLFADLTYLGSDIDVEVNDPTAGFEHYDVVEFLKADPGFFRIDVATGAWQPGAALVHELYDVAGAYNPLGLRDYNAYYWSVGHRGSPQYNFLGVKYVLATKAGPPGDATFVLAYTESPEIDVYLNTGGLPRALLVYRAVVVPDQEAAWDAVHAADFDPANAVVVQGGPALDVDPGEAERWIRYTHYDLNRVGLQVSTPLPAYLVLSEVDYPGWRAEVDEEPVPIWTANYAFRAVYLEPGEHQVEMRFAPRSWTVGLGLSALTWLGVLAWAAWCWWRARRVRRG